MVHAVSPIRLPGSNWRPLRRAMSHTVVAKDIICVHTLVGTADGAWSWAHQVGSHYHCYLHGSGRQDQVQDLRYRSAANLHGNHRVIALGCADMGSPFARWSGRCGDVPAFTGAQVDRLVRDIAWLCARFNIPPRLIPDTRSGRRGVAYHRQGIDPWRVAGGELWSRSTGKCCPDHRRINQINNVILPRVRAVLAGTPTPTPRPEPKPEPRRVKDDEAMMMIAAPKRRTTLLVGGRAVPMRTEADRDKIRWVATAAGLLVDMRDGVSADQFDQFIRSHGGDPKDFHTGGG